MATDPNLLTETLRAVEQGDAAAQEELLGLVYRELRRMAHGQLLSERKGHTLQTTALVHECYLKMFKGASRSWSNRAHFFGAAAQSIRRILVDHARSKKRLKRGGERLRLELDENGISVETDASELDLIALDEALKHLHQEDARKARVVDHLFFLRFSPEETAELLGVSARTVYSDWRFARAWLHRELAGEVKDTED